MIYALGLFIKTCCTSRKDFAALSDRSDNPDLLGAVRRAELSCFRDKTHSPLACPGHYSETFKDGQFT